MVTSFTRFTALLCIAVSFAESITAAAVIGATADIQAEKAFFPLGKRYSSNDNASSGKNDPGRILASGDYNNFCRELLQQPQYGESITDVSTGTSKVQKRTSKIKTTVTDYETITETISTTKTVTPYFSIDETTTIFTATEDVTTATHTVTLAPETVHTTISVTDVATSTQTIPVTVTVTAVAPTRKRSSMSSRAGIPYELRRYSRDSLFSACKELIRLHPRTKKEKETITGTPVKTKTLDGVTTITSTSTYFTTLPTVTETVTSSFLTVLKNPVTATVTETPEPYTSTWTTTIQSTTTATYESTTTSTTSPPAPTTCLSTSRSNRVASTSRLTGELSGMHIFSGGKTGEECCIGCFNTPGCVMWRLERPAGSCLILYSYAGAFNGPSCPTGSGTAEAKVSIGVPISSVPFEAGNGPCGTLKLVNQ